MRSFPKASVILDSSQRGSPFLRRVNLWVSVTTEPPAHPTGSGPELGVRLITVPQEKVIRELAPT